jgi:anti-anti-sigma factor
MLIEIENRQGVGMLRLKGRFVMATDPDYLRSKTDEIKAQDHLKLLVDLSEVSSICSTEIGFLVDLYTSTTKKAGGRFILAGANPRVREVLNLTRLSTVIPLAADTASGLAALSD